MSWSASSVAVYGMLPTNTEREPCDPLDMLLVCPLVASQFITLLLCFPPFWPLVTRITG